MIPETCLFCKGKVNEGYTDFLGRAGDEVIIIKHIPAVICERCGEAYYSPETSKKIDEIMRQAHQKKLCLRPVPAVIIEYG
jgi:YgiT-type zinc finger domain-containing protein